MSSSHSLDPVDRARVRLFLLNFEKELFSQVAVLESRTGKANEKALEKAKALRQSILKKAFEGKLLSAAEIARCKQDKDYEPAGVLLERIKKEKK